MKERKIMLAVDDCDFLSHLITEEIAQLFETKLIYNRNNIRTQICVYSKEPQIIGEVINFNSDLLAKEKAKNELVNLITKKILNIVNNT